MSSDDRRYNPKQLAQDAFVARATEAGMDDGLPAKCCARCEHFEDRFCYEDDIACEVLPDDYCEAFVDKSSPQ